MSPEVGRRYRVIYKKRYPGDAEKLDEDFIETNPACPGDKIVGRYSLPDDVRTVIPARNPILEEHHA